MYGVYEIEITTGAIEKVSWSISIDVIPDYTRMIYFIKETDKEEHIYIHAADNSIGIIIESHEHGYEYDTAPNPTEHNHALNKSQEPLYRQPPSSHWYESSPYRIMQHPRPTR